MAAILNSLLAALPRKSYLRLLPGLIPVELEFGEVLYEPGRADPRTSTFPPESLVSLLTLVEGHLALEVGMVGPRGHGRLPARPRRRTFAGARAGAGRRVRAAHERDALPRGAAPEPAAAARG